MYQGYLQIRAIRSGVRNVLKNFRTNTPKLLIFPPYTQKRNCKDKGFRKVSRLNGSLNLEILINCDPITRRWIPKFYTNIQISGTLRTELKKTKIMKILKSRKSNDGLIPYQLIALFSMYYTFLEKVIYNQINHVILNTILVKKVGFSTGRSCSVKILALIIFIDANFQNYLKIAAVIVNLSAPYNTV